MKLLLLSTAAVACLLATSCNTFIGMGRDIRQLGQGIENTANKTTKPAPRQTSQQTGGAPVY